MNYCCDDFEISAKGSPGFERQDDGTWTFIDFKEYHIIPGMKHCPFCGERLGWVDHTVASAGGGWAVWSRGARGAYFHTKEEAEKHAKMLQES